MKYEKLFTKRKDGRFVATYTENGKQRFIYDKDPEKLYHKLEAAKNKAPLKFADHVEAWREEHSETVGWKTAESYIAPCRRIVDVFGDDYPAEITAARLQAFLTSLGKRGYSRRTVQLHHDILNMIFDRCVLRGILPVSPMQAVSVPKGLKTTKRTVPEEDALEAVRTHTDAPFAPFALLCLYAGLRRGEVLALRQEDIDRRVGVIHVNKAMEYVGNTPEIKTPKTSTGVRDVPIPSVLMPHIPKHKGYLFQMEDGRPLTKISFRHAWAKYCKAIGHEVTAHQLRHGYATFLYEAGVPVLAAQKMLGHANASTTMNIYTHLREKQEKSAAAKLDDYLSQF
jgi:integrase